jgi:hypothetical protein
MRSKICCINELPLCFLTRGPQRGTDFDWNLLCVTMKSQSLALLGLIASTAFAVPKTKRQDDGNDQPISGGKGAPILGRLIYNCLYNHD